MLQGLFNYLSSDTMTSKNDDDIPIGITDFFAGRSIFVTGGTGFMGKVLIEKLLRSCPDIGHIYLLIREKKGNDAQARLRKMTDIPLFDRLKEERPRAIEEKLVAVYGDVLELNLGLSSQDRRILEDNVSVIFHVAASVRFDDTLEYACLMNTRGTREVMKLASNVKQLVVLMHVSTTYCNADKKVVEEKLYPPLADWQKTIHIVENADKETLKVLTPLYTNRFPNTYTFTKNLGEHVVNDLAKEFKIPAIIFRPSIVISSLHEPMPGWIDNFNGPVSLMAASGKGILRSVYCNPNIKSDYMPVDVSIKAMIVAVWKKAIETEKTNEVTVYNCSSGSVKAITTGDMIEIAKVVGEQYPLSDILWSPGGGVTKYKWWNYILVLLFHLMPAVLVDALLRLAGRKPRLLKIQRKIYTANMALNYFIANEWKFVNDKMLDLDNIVPENERSIWSYYFKDVDVIDYFTNCVKGCRLYLLKESNDTLPQARIHARRMYWLDKIVKTTTLILVIYILFFKIDVLNLITSYFYNSYINMFDDGT